ncbi:winged helix-turn-helix transcriptional regulator [Candidatus Bathyarchaeota archaeon]|nr:winged helix-turn-helix transcriptional regulator [Candidatus Bathyarchaeota archaeon]
MTKPQKTDVEILSRREGGEAGKRRAKDGVLFIMKRLIEGPVYPRDLRRELGFSRGTIMYHLNRLVKYELAKQLKDGRYAFIDYVDGQEQVIEAVCRWRRVAYRHPTVDEVAAEVGMIPEETERLVYGTKAKTGWFPPTPEMVEEAREKLGEALVCAARMKEGKPSNWAETYSDDPETMREGERFLNEHPTMLPKLSKDGMRVASWPTEASRYLGGDYQPKDRSRGTLRRAY